MVPRSVALALLITTPTVAQQGAPAGSADAVPAEGVQDAVALVAAEVHAAHWGEVAPPTLDRFEARLRIVPTRRDEDNVQIDLSARYLRPGPGPDGKPRRPMLRYKVEEPGTVLERGVDQDGFWLRTDQGVERIEGRTDRVTQDTVREHVRLCRQILQFVDPARAILALKVETPPKRKKFEVGPDNVIEAIVVEGTVEAFPMFFPPNPDRPAPACLLRAVVDAENHQLAAVQVLPLDAEGRPGTTGEYLRFGSYAERGGVQLPSKILFHRVARGRKPRLELEVTIRGLDLEPELTVARMARPTR